MINFIKFMMTVMFSFVLFIVFLGFLGAEKEVHVVDTPKGWHSPTELPAAGVDVFVRPDGTWKEIAR